QVQLDAGMPRHQVRPFRLGLLHAVLAEHALAGRNDGLDGLRAEGLGDGDQGDRRGIASCLPARRLDLAADGSELPGGSDRSGCDVRQDRLRACTYSSLKIARIAVAWEALTGGAAMTPPRIYLAGPDVFLADPTSVFAAKRRLCTDYGFVGVPPVDDATDLSTLSKRDAVLRISAHNETLIRTCNLLIANLTPFRGPSADVGTAYELGFARALGLPVFAYSNVAGNLLERTHRHLGAQVRPRGGGGLEDTDGMLLEDFDRVDNLMLDGAVEASGAYIVVTPTPADRRFVDLAGFEACLKLAARHFAS